MKTNDSFSDSDDSTWPGPGARIEELPDGRYLFELSADPELAAKIELARALMCEQDPDADLSVTFERALELFIEGLLVRKA